MRDKAILTLTLVLTASVFLHLATSQPASEVKAGLSPESIEVEPGSSFTLKLVVFEGGSLVISGEFNISYKTDSLELLNVTPSDEWTVKRVGSKYLFYTLKAQPNTTTIAVFWFKFKQDTPTNVTLSHFKAADARAKDLRVSMKPATATVKPKVYTPPEAGTTQPGVTIIRERGLPLAWIVVIALSAAVVAIASVYHLKARAVEAYSLVDRSGRVIFRTSSRDRVYGREDFAGIVPQEKLAYITRRSSGGQFRIIRGSDGWYIIDSHSTNPTLVNGIPIKGRGYVRLRNGDSISLKGVFEFFFYGG